jgi:hypothetical protein
MHGRHEEILYRKVWYTFKDLLGREWYGRHFTRMVPGELIPPYPLRKVYPARPTFDGYNEFEEEQPLMTRDENKNRVYQDDPRQQIYAKLENNGVPHAPDDDLDNIASQACLRFLQGCKFFHTLGTCKEVGQDRGPAVAKRADLDEPDRASGSGVDSGAKRAKLDGEVGPDFEDDGALDLLAL